MSRAAAAGHVALPGIDTAAVADWIATLGLGEVAPLRFARLGRGQSHLTFLVTDGNDRRWVLRRPPLGYLLASAHDIVREHRILSALQGTDVPAPAALALCRNSAVSDVPLLLMEHVEGQVVEDMAVAESLPPAHRARIGRSLAMTLARVHNVDLVQTGLDSLASHAPYAARQLKRWRTQWDRSRSRELPAIERLAERLHDAMPGPAG